MRKVFSNHSEVAHIFAQRTQNEGRAGNIFFKNDTIYSYGYHFPIAKFITNRKGQTKVLFTLNNYSNSTSKHIGIVSSALSHYDIVYTYSVNYPIDSVKRINDNIETLFEKLGKARKPQIYVNLILEEVNILRNLIDNFTDIKVYKKDYPILYGLLKQGNSYFSSAIMDKVKNQAKKEREKKIVADAKKLKDWYNFEKYVSAPQSQKTYLRYNPELNKVETSKNIRLEVKEAKTIFNVWEHNPSKLVGKRILGYYIVNRCTPKLLIAGCHTIEFKEAQRIAKELNF